MGRDSLLNVLADERRQVSLDGVRNRVGLSDDGRREGVRVGRRLAEIEVLDGLDEDALRGLRVRLEVPDDLLDRHRRVALVPAVVVGDQRHRRIADLRLAGELRLLEIRHADDVAAPGAVELRLRKVENWGPSMQT